MKPKSFHATVVDHLAAMIVGGGGSALQQLPTEGELCQQLGVSRTILREAVKTLAAKGLLVTGPRIGTRVQPASAWNVLDPEVIRWRLAAGVDQAFVRDIFELRLTIEPEAARLAASRADKDDIATLKSAYAAMEQAVNGGGKGYIEADLAFHKTILAAAHNQFFAALTPAVSSLLKVSFRLSVKSRESARSSLPLHRDVATAIAEGKAAFAEQTMRSLIRSALNDIESDMTQDDFFVTSGGVDAAA
jgi:DNA-binding FadR family transcriptional regulator